MPIPIVQFCTTLQEREQYLEKAKSLYEGYLSEKDQDSLLDFVDYHLSQKPAQSDVVHDLLNYLAEQLIVINKTKQAEIKGFLTWLEHEIGASTDDLTPKARLVNYLGDYQKNDSNLSFEELLTILRKNQRKLKYDVGSRAFQERLNKEYQASLDKLLPLKAHLAATDKIIDQIVYRLYGLTEAELAETTVIKSTS